MSTLIDAAGRTLSPLNDNSQFPSFTSLHFFAGSTLLAHVRLAYDPNRLKYTIELSDRRRIEGLFIKTFSRVFEWGSTALFFFLLFACGARVTCGESEQLFWWDRIVNEWDFFVLCCCLRPGLVCALRGRNEKINNERREKESNAVRNSSESINYSRMLFLRGRARKVTT